MRAVRIGAKLFVWLVLGSCAPPLRQVVPVVTPKPQQLMIAGDTTGLGSLLALLSDSVAGQPQSVAASPDLEALLRSMDDTSWSNALLRQNDSAFAQVLGQLSDTLNAREHLHSLPELEALLRSLEDTSLASALLRGQDAGSASLRNLLKCLGDSTKAHSHPR